MNSKIGLWLLAVLAGLSLHASESPESLRQKLKVEVDSKSQIRLLNQLGEYFLQQNFDSAFRYLDQAYQIAFEKERSARQGDEAIGYKKLRTEAFKNKVIAYDVHGFPEMVHENVDRLFTMGSELNDTLVMITARISSGNAHNTQGNYPSAIESYSKALELAKTWPSELHQARASKNLGIVYYYQGNLSLSAFNTGEAIRLFTKLGDQLGKAGSMLLLGNLLADEGQNERAIGYYQEAYEGFEGLNHQIGMLNALLNIGTVLHQQGLYQDAIEQYIRAREIAEEVNDEMTISRCLHNIGLSYMELNQPNQAITYFNQALGIATENNFTHLQAHTLGSMAGAYNDIRRYNQAYRHALQSLSLSREIESVSMLSTAYRNLWRAQEGLGNFRRALEYHKSFKLYNDSVTNMATRLEINRMEMQFKNERLQDQVIRQDAELEAQKTELVRQSTSLRLKQTENILLTAGSVALLVILILVFLNLRKKKRINELTLMQKEKIESINEQLVNQNKDISRKREEIERQKSIIEENNQTLVSSIHYAQSIQRTLLPSKDKLDDCLGDHFLIFEPKAIVSGDFYWVGKHQNQILVALADSAGHGVPGAFLSVLGISFLNEYLYKHTVHTPAQILNEFRLYIINSLNQDKSLNPVHEGIELALMIINKIDRSVVFSGACTPLLIASKSDVLVNGQPVSKENGALIKIKPDGQALSYTSKMETYNDIEIRVQDGSMLYVATDGFADQFRHPTNERFTSQRLHEILSEIFELPADTQKEVLLDVFRSWKQEKEQIDDVAIIGIRF